MYNFKVDTVNIIKASQYNEGDKNEYMEAFINVYKDGVYDGIGINQIYVKVNNYKGYFRWCDDKIHEFTSLRNAAIEVIQACIESIKNSKPCSYEDRKFLEGSAHNILNSLIA